LYIFIKFELECTQLGAIPFRSVEECIKNLEILFRNSGAMYGRRRRTAEDLMGVVAVDATRRDDGGCVRHGDMMEEV
jgi:hypothetical protein